MYVPHSQCIVALILLVRVSRRKVRVNRTELYRIPSSGLLKLCLEFSGNLNGTSGLKEVFHV